MRGYRQTPRRSIRGVRYLGDEEGARRSRGSARDCRRDTLRIIKKRAEAAGFDPTIFSGHSLQAGFVTSALHPRRRHSLRHGRETRHREVSTLKTYDRRTKAFKKHAGDAFL